MNTETRIPDPPVEGQQQAQQQQAPAPAGSVTLPRSDYELMAELAREGAAARQAAQQQQEAQQAVPLVAPGTPGGMSPAEAQRAGINVGAALLSHFAVKNPSRRHPALGCDFGG